MQQQQQLVEESDDSDAELNETGDFGKCLCYATARKGQVS